MIRKIGDRAVPPPDNDGQAIIRTDFDSENTGRNDAGILTSDRIRAGVYSFSYTWHVNKANLQLLLQLTKPNKFSVTIYEPEIGDIKTLQMKKNGNVEYTTVYSAPPGKESQNLYLVKIPFVEY